MKKITLLLLLLISSLCYSQIHTVVAIEAGYETRSLGFNDFSVQPVTFKTIDWLENKAVTTISVDVLFKNITVYTDIKTYITPIHLYSYRPYQIQYLSGIQYEFAKIPLSLRATHMCSHSVDSRMFREAFTTVTARLTILNTLKSNSN